MSFYPCRMGGGTGINFDKLRYPIDAGNGYDTSPLQRLNCITYNESKGISTFTAPEDCELVYLAGPGSFRDGSFKYNGTGEQIYAGYTMDVNSKLGIYKNVKKGETITFSGSDMGTTIRFSGYSFIILK